MFSEAQRINLSGASWLDYYPGWLRWDSAALAAFCQSIPWRQHRLKLYGRWVDEPRLSVWVADPGCHYRYSGQLRESLPWPEQLQRLREQLQQHLQAPFNSVLANRYRDGQDAMGWHSDDEAELGEQPLIASLSLGAVRRFLIRQKGSAKRMELSLGNGDLLVMGGNFQRHYQHAVARTQQAVGERINLTFRQIITAG